MDKKLNQNFDDIIITPKESDSNVLLNFDKPKRKRKAKEQIEQQIPQQIVEILPLEDFAAQQMIVNINKKQELIDKQKNTENVENIVKTVTKRKRKAKEQKTMQQLNNAIVETETEIVNQQETEIVKTFLEETNNVDLSNVDVEEVIEEVGEAITEIPNINIEISDLDIKPIPTQRKDKTGYFKTKVSIKKSNIPKVINIIASYIKQQSNGIIKPRVCDMRVIGNTNKTQLRNSSLKLSLATVVFKPDVTKLKVNKGTRFMISVPDNHSSTENLIVYLQESRAKSIIELSPKDFGSFDAMIEFVGDRIAEFFYVGYDVTLKKLQLRGKENPLMRVINNALKTQDYKVKPYSDDDNHIYMCDFIYKGEENQWLTVRFEEASIPGYYNIKGINNVSGMEYTLNSEPKTLSWLEGNVIEVLTKSFTRDWSNELNAEGGNNDEIYYSLNKLSHNKLKNTLLEINQISEESPEFGINIKKVLSKRDMAKLQSKDYDSESIIGDTVNCDWFILSYLAYQIIGGDSRKGRQYITKDQYYDKYSVNDRRAYQEREKTILRKEGEERNYNARPYIFQLEYSVNGNKYIYRSKSFSDVLTATNFLYLPNINVESPIK